MFTREEKHKYEIRNFEHASDSHQKAGMASKIGAMLKAGTTGLSPGKATGSIASMKTTVNTNKSEKDISASDMVDIALRVRTQPRTILRQVASPQPRR